MEARLYAEDPAQEFLPSTGRLDHFVLGGRICVDTGVEESDRISPYYDPMIAKLIAHGRKRDSAIEPPVVALAQVEVWPVKTPAATPSRAPAHPGFPAGEGHHRFSHSQLQTHGPE